MSRVAPRHILILRIFILVVLDFGILHFGILDFIFRVGTFYESSLSVV